MPARRRAGRPLLVIASSGRVPAAAARAAGRTAHVIDLFGDCDTAALAASLTRIRAGADSSLDGAALLRAVSRVQRRHGPMPIVLGSGLEGQAGVVAALAERHCVLGPDADALAAIADRPRALARLARHPGVRVPATRARPPARRAGWLAKRIGACGGGHVRAAADATPAAGTYYQRLVVGRSVSALLLAARGECVLVGVAEHLRWHPAASARWRYEGALTSTRIPAAIARDYLAAGRAAAREFALCGCFGLDFIRTPDGRHVLVDINPRLPATLELHADMGRILSAHVAACREGVLLYSRPPVRAAKGHLVLYAERRWRVPEDLAWPSWIADRSPPGASIGAGDPLCTLRAGARTRRDLLAALVRRWRDLHARLGGAPHAPLPRDPCLRYVEES